MSISSCTDNLESLFLEITNANEPIIVGVVYRPPSGDANLFYTEIASILSELPTNSTIHILGDFNVDLFNTTNHDNMQFEDVVISSGYTPLISTHTHHRNNCKKACIDNILTNDHERVVVSGTIFTDTHHKPIFQMSYTNSYNTTNVANKSKIYYDYSPKNIDKFCNLLQTSSENLNGIEDFESFAAFYQNAIDQTCKLEAPRLTKRTSIANPWITSGIITSINEKTRL